MKLSHSSMSCILSCPMTYYLRYKQGIRLKAKKPALQVGSDVHWGLEHATDNLEQYFIDDSRYVKDTTYTREQVLAEAMVHGFLNRKAEIFDKILINPKDGSKLKLVEELHELELTAKLKSYSFDVPNEFMGIIDLLLLVEDENGKMYFIILDYKTSSFEPDWNEYLDQIYRYIFLVQSIYPQVPILKIGIINLIKSKLRWLSGETEASFTRRLRTEYELNTDLITYHEFETEKLDKQKIDSYILNLSRQADCANAIDLNNTWFINYANAMTKYGKADYYDIFYKTPYAHVMYEIRDDLYDNATNQRLTMRDCKAIDMLVIDHSNVLNKYEQFKAQALAYYSIHNDITKDAFIAELKKSFIVDDELLDAYWSTLMHDIETKDDNK